MAEVHRLPGVDPGAERSAKLVDVLENLLDGARKGEVVGLIGGAVRVGGDFLPILEFDAVTVSGAIGLLSRVSYILNKMAENEDV